MILNNIPSSNNIPSTNDYLYYVIEDNDHNVRGHVIGVQHWVEPKDQNLNPRILEAIDRSARVILEIPPDSKAPLLPINSKNYKVFISEAMSEVKSMPKSEKSLESNSLEVEIEKVLKEIEDKESKSRDTGQQDHLEIKNKGYEGIKKVLADLSPEEKLFFLKMIQKSVFDFNLVSLERKINKKVIKAKKEIEPLEKEDLNIKLLDARINIGLRHIKEKMPESDYKKIVEQLQNLDARINIGLRYIKEKMPEPDYQKLVEQLQNIVRNWKLEIVQEHKNQLGIKNNPPISHEEEQALKEELYRAWVDGNVEKLKDLLKTVFEVFKEEPEMHEVHQPRDKQMAERIIKVVCETKKENSEAAFMMGCGHLLYTNLESNRTNIIDYLNDHFQSDLKGWSIRQITKNDTIPFK